MSKPITPILPNEVYGRLTVIEETPSRINKSGRTLRYAKCICTCGNYTETRIDGLRSGSVLSCGCLHKENFKRDAAVNIGDRFGRLIIQSEDIVKVSKGGSRKKSWNLLCDCGNTHKATTASLTGGHVKSCGCLHKEASVLNSINSRHKIIKKDRGLNNVLGTYKTGAKQRNLIFDLSKEEVEILIKDNCFYCGQPPSNTINISTLTYGKKEYLYNGIDRIDNSIGYIKENCVTCCSTCNHAKHTLTYSSFLSWIGKAYKHLEVLIQREMKNGTS
jgi:5-methylcytosine-specific restriction endonuclease McrA